jgi:hypothetical protein
MQQTGTFFAMGLVLVTLPISVPLLILLMASRNRGD